jgi:hypothetical protein
MLIETETYTFHEAANLFPMLAAHELEALANDIKQTGLLNPIVLYQGQIIDGRNRYLACQRAGVEPHFIQWEPNGISPLDWVISQNIHRRHLNASQRACLGRELKCKIALEAKPGTDAAEEAAKLVGGVSRRYIFDAQKIHDTDPAMYDRVRRGEISFPDAKNVLKHGTKEQKQKRKEELEKLDEDVRLRWAAAKDEQKRNADVYEADFAQLIESALQIVMVGREFSLDKTVQAAADWLIEYIEAERIEAMCEGELEPEPTVDYNAIAKERIKQFIDSIAGVRDPEVVRQMTDEHIAEIPKIYGVELEASCMEVNS